MEQNKPEYHVVSLSGGKDSTAMLLMMLEKGMPVDDILFCDTGLEFPGLYAHLDKVEQYIGRPIIRIQAPHSFEYYFCQHIVFWLASYIELRKLLKLWNTTAATRNGT